MNAIKDLKIRNIYPFYISNPNSIFFSTNIRKYKNNLIYKKMISNFSEKDEVEKILEIEKINYHNTIQKIIDNTLKKINLIIGSKNVSIFLPKKNYEASEAIFAVDKDKVNDLKILGDKTADKRYIFGIDINPESYLGKYVSEIQINFYFDEKNKMISGAASLNWSDKESDEENFSKIIEKVFTNRMCRFFLENEFKKISIAGILNLFDDLKIDNKDEIYLNCKIKKNWDNYFNKKLLNNKEPKSQKEMDDLFNSMFISKMLILIIYEDLKSYFTSKNPEIFLSSINKNNEFENKKESINSNNDFINLFKFVKSRYVFYTELDFEEIETADEAYDLIKNISRLEEQSYWYSIPSYEITRNSDVPFFIENEDIFLENKDFKLFFLFTMYPQLFGTEITNTNFSTLSEIISLFEKIDFKDTEIEKDLINKSNSLVCERNYDYITFINPSLSFLIIKNDNPLSEQYKLNKNENWIKDPNFKLFNNYLWAIIYNQSKLWKLISIEQLAKFNKEKAPGKLRNYLYEVNALQFDWYDEFYGLFEIKKIIQKINSYSNFTDSLALFNKKLNRDDQRYGKSKERHYLSFGVSTAAIFGILDFFTCIFTIITVQNQNIYGDPSQGISGSIHDPRNMSIIGIGAVLAFILLTILIYAITIRLKDNYHAKKNYKKR